MSRIAVITILLLSSFFCRAQNVGIGTINPQAKLHLKNDFEVLRLQGQSPYLTFYDNAGNNTGYLWNALNNAMEVGTPYGSGFPVYMAPGTNRVASFLPNGNVGFGISNPQARLHVLKDNESVRLQGQSPYLSFFDNSGNYTGYVWNRSNNSVDVGTPAGSNFPVYISPNTITQATFHPNGNLGLGVSDPGFRLDLLGRMRIRSGTETPGIWLNNSANTASPAFVGLMNDNAVGFYGSTGAGWMFYMNTSSGMATFGNTVRAADFQYNTPKTHVYSIGANDLRTHNGWGPQLSIDSYWAPAFSSGSYTVFTGPVHLPDGATVTSITATLYDNSPTEDFLISLSGFSNSSAPLEIAVGTITTSGTPGYATLSTSTLPNPVINNALYNYGIYIFGTPNWTSETLRIKCIVISYTLDKPF